MPTPPSPRRVRRPLDYPRLNPADRPDPAAVEAERRAATTKRRGSK